MDLYTIISTIIIPLIVQVLKKLKLPSKWAPIAAYVVAGLLVGLGKMIGLNADVNTFAEAILKALLQSGVAVQAYDAIKKLSGK